MVFYRVSRFRIQNQLKNCKNIVVELQIYSNIIKILLDPSFSFCVRRGKSTAYDTSSTVVSGSSLKDAGSAVAGASAMSTASGFGVAGASALSSAGDSGQAGGLGMASGWSSTAYNLSSAAVAAPTTHEYTSFYSKEDAVHGTNRQVNLKIITYALRKLVIRGI